MRLKTTTVPMVQQFGFFKNKRQISLASFPISNTEGKTVSVILRSESDFDYTRETPQEYRARSSEYLTKRSYEAFGPNPFILLKVNQTVIDYREWAAGRLVVKFIGHVFSGIFSAGLGREQLDFLPGSLLSKVSSDSSNFFEDDDTIMRKRLITSQYITKKSATAGSQEYFWQISPEILDINTHTYIHRIIKLKADNKPYNINLASCGHVVYYGLTGNRLPINKSPQTAAVKSVFDVLKNNDEILVDNLRKALLTSKLSDAADEVDKSFNSIRQHFT